MCAGGEREGLYISDGSLSLLSRDYGIDQFDAAAQSHQITTTLDGLMEEGGGKEKEGGTKNKISYQQDFLLKTRGRR